MPTPGYYGLNPQQNTVAPAANDPFAWIMQLLKGMGNGATPLPGTGELTGPMATATPLVQPDTSTFGQKDSLPIAPQPGGYSPQVGSNALAGLSAPVPGLAEHTPSAAAPLFSGIQPGLSAPVPGMSVPGAAPVDPTGQAGAPNKMDDFMKALGAVQAPQAAPPQHITSPPPPRYVPPPAGELLKILLGTGVTGDPLLLSKILPRG